MGRQLSHRKTKLNQIQQNNRINLNQAIQITQNERNKLNQVPSPPTTSGLESEWDYSVLRWLGVTQGYRQHNHSIERIRLTIRI